MSRARLVEKGERPGGADHGCAELGRLGWWVGLCALSGVCVCVRVERDRERHSSKARVCPLGRAERCTNLAASSMQPLVQIISEVR